MEKILPYWSKPEKVIMSCLAAGVIGLGAYLLEGNVKDGVRKMRTMWTENQRTNNNSKVDLSGYVSDSTNVYAPIFKGGQINLIVGFITDSNGNKVNVAVPYDAQKGYNTNTSDLKPVDRGMMSPTGIRITEDLGK